MEPPFNMLIVGMTGSGKTMFLLRMLEKEYKNRFDHIIIVCPTLDWNKTYQEWKYLGDENVFTVPCKHEQVEGVLSVVSNVFRGSTSLIIIDDCASGQTMRNRVSEVVNLAFSARHYNLSTVVITQQLTAVTKPYRENISRLVTFYNPNRHDMRVIIDDYLNGVPQEELEKIVKILRNTKFTALDISLRHPFNYNISYSNNAKTQNYPNHSR